MRMVLFLVACLSFAAPLRGEELFPVPRGMSGNVGFWLRVYSEWPTNRYAIHDDIHLDIVYKVIAATDGRSAIVSQAKAEVEQALARLDAKRPASANGLAGLDREVFLAWSKHQDPARFRKARGHVRHQKGQQNRFAEALKQSGKYRALMESILQDHGVPKELMALVFVESVFQIRARSHSGAVGLWQFMSYTGREYLNINNVVDERHDPVIATYAAASYLRSAYKRLKVWPVAITSYNYGMNGMARAISSVGSTDLAKILASYRTGRLGFAAKNYYTEFLAALKVFRNPQKYFPGTHFYKPWKYDVVRLPAAVSVVALAKAGAVSADSLAAYNPALSRDALRGRVRLPAGMALRVPLGAQKKFVNALSSIRGLSVANAAKERRYTVRSGDSIIAIARRHGVHSGPLLSANNLRRDQAIHPGQILNIPPKAKGYTLLPEARGIKPPQLPAKASQPVAVALLQVEKKNAKSSRQRAVKSKSRVAARPGKPSIRRTRGPSGRATMIAGPALALESRFLEPLEESIAVDVTTGFHAMPQVDIVTGYSRSPRLDSALSPGDHHQSAREPSHVLKPNGD